MALPKIDFDQNDHDQHDHMTTQKSTRVSVSCPDDGRWQMAVFSAHPLT